MLDFSINQKKGGLDLTAIVQVGSGVSALLGVSGAGKTSLLRLLAGFEKPDEGHIRIGDKVLFDSDKGINLSVQAREIGMVFQEPRLLPHLSVRENVRLGTKKDAALFDQIVSQFQLAKLFERPVAALSGGEQQRVALARAILQKPRLFLLDEPMSFLDVTSAQQLLPFIESMVSAAQVPMIYVTHAIDEAARLAENGLIIEQGQVVKQGAIEDVLSHWQSGSGDNGAGGGTVSILSANVTGFDPHYGLLRVEVDGRVLEIVGDQRPIGAKVQVIIWARDVILSMQPVENISARNQLTGVLDHVSGPHGGFCEVSVRIGAQKLRTRITEKSCAEMGLLRTRAIGEAIVALVKSSALEDSL